MGILDPKTLPAANLTGLLPEASVPTRLTAGELAVTYARVVVPTGLVGGQDCTTAIQTAATKARADGVPLLIPRAANGLPYKMSAILQAWTGARIIFQGGVLDFLTDGTATGRGLYVGSATGGAGVSDVVITAPALICSNAVSRRGVYGLLSIFDSQHVTIHDAKIGNDTALSGGESTGIFTSNTADFKIIRPHVKNTLADGIHVSRGSIRGVIDHPIVVGAQDDGIGLVSVRQDGAGPIYGPVRFVEVNQPIVTGGTVLGSCVALVGAQDCSVNGGHSDSAPAHVFVVAQANYGGIINAARNSINGLSGTNPQHASQAFRVSNADTTTITGLQVSGGLGGGQVLSSTNTQFNGGRVASTGSEFGIYADGPSTRTLVTGMDLTENGATGYKVLRGTVAGGAKTLIATLGRVLTYTDTGLAGTAATVPASNTAGLTAPTASLGATATSGGTFVAGTYYWIIVAINAKGETLGSNEVSATLAVNGTQVLNWGAIINAILLQGAGSLETANIKS